MAIIRFSSSFANPAVAIGSSIAVSFNSLNVNSLPVYLAGEIIGFLIALPFAEWMFVKKSFIIFISELISSTENNNKNNVLVNNHTDPEVDLITPEHKFSNAN